MSTQYYNYVYLVLQQLNFKKLYIIKTTISTLCTGKQKYQYKINNICSEFPEMHFMSLKLINKWV